MALRSDVVRAARSAGDRAELAESLEWLACDLRDARRFEEAALAFGEAFEVGTHVVVGSYSQPAAARKNISGFFVHNSNIYWNLKKTGN